MTAFFQDAGHWESFTRIIVRLGTACLVGGLLGLQREIRRKNAGLRTHILVSVGSALFVLVPQEFGIATDHLSRVVQGIVVGIGFLGSGTIIKLNDQGEVLGLTTAATIWLAAAAGLSLGIGLLWPAVLGVLLSVGVLTALGRLEVWLERLGGQKTEK